MSLTKANIKALDLLWAKFIKLRAKSACEYCGKTERLNSHHIFSRSNRSTRWDTDNGVSLCVAHHVFGNLSAHKAPLEFAEWLKDTRGKEWFNRLRKNSSKISKNIEFEKVKEALIKATDELK